MPGAAREPKHTHLYDEVILEIRDGDWLDFAVALCKVCGHYLVIMANQHRIATKTETELIAHILSRREKHQ